MKAALGGAGILFDVASAAAEAFGPLKATLSAISTIYEKYEVRLQSFAQNGFLTKPTYRKQLPSGRKSETSSHA